MRLKGLLRRSRHISGIYPSWLNLDKFLGRVKKPAKHLKIDDEEHQLPTVNGSTPPNGTTATLKLALLFTVLLIFGINLAHIIYKPPYTLIKLLQWKYAEVTFHFPPPSFSHRKVISLTIDDSPSSETTKILDLLHTFGAKATFFVIGKQIVEYPHVVQRIFDEGHEVGIHGWSDEASYSLPLPELVRQIREMEQLLPKNSHRSKWFRPGSGWFSKPMISMLRTLGYQIVLGSIYPHDPQIPFPRINAAHVLSLIRPGAIIIMHDRRPYSSRQLELILNGLADDDWTVQTLSATQQIMKAATIVSNR